MGIVASIVGAIVAGVAEAAADAAAVAATAAGAAADAVASGMELVGSVGEAAADSVPLLEEGEEETIFDASELGGGGGYSDEGAINDPWNWEAEAQPATRVSRAALGTSLAAIGVGAGIATGIGLAVGSKTQAGADVLQSGQNITQVLASEGFPELGSRLPDSILAFMTPEEYELACEALKERQTHGDFNPDTLEEAENAVVYASPEGRLPYAEKDPSLLFDVATSDEPGPWFLPGAAGQPLTRGMLQRARQAREIIERGQEVSRGFQLSAELRRELRRTGGALERVYQEVLNRQPRHAPPAEEIVRRAMDQARDLALEQGLEAGAGAVANVLGGGVIASTLASLAVAGGKYLYDQYTGPSLPQGSVQIEDSKYDVAPWYVRALGGLWRKHQATYIVNEDGRLGTVNIGYYSPDLRSRGLPSTEPWYHFPKRDPEQLENLKLWLSNNWGGNHTYLGLDTEGNFVIGDLVLQEALYRRKWVTKNARPKRGPRNPRPSSRPKRARRARN